MKKTSIFSAGLLLLVSSGFFLYMASRKPKKVEGFPWAELRKDALVGMEIELGMSSEKFSLAFNQGEWKLVKPEYYQTLPDKVAILANTFMTLKPKSILTNLTVEEYNAYGFSTPRVHFTARVKGGKNIALLLGKETSIGEDIYAAVEGVKEIAYIVPSKEAAIFFQGMNTLINNNILVENSDRLNRIMFRNLKNESQTFEKIESFWIERPSGDTNKDWGVRRFILSAQDLKFETKEIIYNVSSAQLLEAGIDTNLSPMLSFTFDDDKTSTIFVGKKISNYYAVYLPEMKLSALVHTDLINGIFSYSSKDMVVKKKVIGNIYGLFMECPYVTGALVLNDGAYEGVLFKKDVEALLKEGDDFFIDKIMPIHPLELEKYLFSGKPRSKNMIPCISNEGKILSSLSYEEFISEFYTEDFRLRFSLMDVFGAYEHPLLILNRFKTVIYANKEAENIFGCNSFGSKLSLLLEGFDVSLYEEKMLIVHDNKQWELFVARSQTPSFCYDIYQFFRRD